MLSLEGIHAFYGPVHVLFSVDLEVGDGEIVALLGTNGAGKTTILRTISGVLHPQLGHVTWNGERIDGLRPAEIVRRGIVQMPGGRGVFPGMTIHENLEMAGFLYGRDRAKRKEMIDRTLEAHETIIEKVREAIEKTEQSRDMGSNDLLMGDVLRRHELQVWFLAEHIVEVPLTEA